MGPLLRHNARPGARVANSPHSVEKPKSVTIHPTTRFTPSNFVVSLCTVLAWYTPARAPSSRNKITKHVDSFADHCTAAQVTTKQNEGRCPRGRYYLLRQQKNLMYHVLDKPPLQKAFMRQLAQQCATPEEKTGTQNKVVGLRFRSAHELLRAGTVSWTEGGRDKHFGVQGKRKTQQNERSYLPMQNIATQQTEKKTKDKGRVDCTSTQTYRSPQEKTIAHLHPS